jgi:hypothetical protein
MASGQRPEAFKRDVPTNIDSDVSMLRLTRHPNEFFNGRSGSNLSFFTINRVKVLAFGSNGHQALDKRLEYPLSIDLFAIIAIETFTFAVSDNLQQSQCGTLWSRRTDRPNVGSLPVSCSRDPRSSLYLAVMHQSARVLTHDS